MTTETMTAGFSPPRSYIDRRSYIELNGRARAHSLVDDGTAKELVGPFDRIMSPWLRIAHRLSRLRNPFSNKSPHSSSARPKCSISRT
jgi:hypothetical protein